MDKTTLVTGGTGLIGYNIIRSLLKKEATGLKHW